jgi:hypothetical protein
MPAACFPEGSQRKPACPEVSVVESQPHRSKHTDSAPCLPHGQSPLEVIADLLENLPTNACVELTRRFILAASSITTGEARQRAALKTFSCSLPSMAVRPRTNGEKALRLAYWNADGVRGRKRELEPFLSEHGVDICFLNETHLQSGKALRFANYVCHRTDRPTRGEAQRSLSAMA